MNNNDILRRIRYTFDFDDFKMIELFNQGGKTVSRSEVSNWLKKDTDPDFQFIDDSSLEVFLNGFIIEKRGKKEGAEPIPASKLNNNLIFRKLKIALNLKDDDILEILTLADFRFSKHELSAIFRNPSQSQYRICKDQVLRNFLHGIQVKYRDNKNQKPPQ